MGWGSLSATTTTTAPRTSTSRPWGLTIYSTITATGRSPTSPRKRSWGTRAGARRLRGSISTGTESWTWSSATTAVGPRRRTGSVSTRWVPSACAGLDQLTRVDCDAEADPVTGGTCGRCVDRPGESWKQRVEQVRLRDSRRDHQEHAVAAVVNGQARLAESDGPDGGVHRFVQDRSGLPLSMIVELAVARHVHCQDRVVHRPWGTPLPRHRRQTRIPSLSVHHDRPPNRVQEAKLARAV